MDLVYKEREKIESIFNEWCVKNHVARTPNAFVAFMQINGWLDVKKIKKDLGGIK